jgi:hypothetical protein
MLERMFKFLQKNMIHTEIEQQLSSRLRMLDEKLGKIAQL